MFTSLEEPTFSCAFLSCLCQLSAALTGASSPHTVPSLPSFFLCLPKSFSDSISSLSPRLFLANCTEPRGGYSPEKSSSVSSWVPEESSCLHSPPLLLFQRISPHGFSSEFVPLQRNKDMRIGGSFASLVFKCRYSYS